MEEKNFFDLIGLADLASLGNLLLGFIGVVFLLRGNEMGFIKSILFAGLLDGVDGVIARKRYENSSSFGIEIDSLADLVSFGFAPALFFWIKVDLSTPYLIVPLAFLAVSMLRLARYNVIKNEKEFIGVPTTCAGLILIMLLSFDIPYFAQIMVISSLTLTFLMISPFNFPKIRTKFLIPIGILLVLLISFNGTPFYLGKTLLLTLLASYIIFGPVIKWNPLAMN